MIEMWGIFKTVYEDGDKNMCVLRLTLRTFNGKQEVVNIPISKEQIETLNAIFNQVRDTLTGKKVFRGKFAIENFEKKKDASYIG